MFKYALAFTLFFTSSFVRNEPYENFWIVWNVGQGLWVTQVTPDRCMHFDVGGEFGRFKHIKLKLRKLCAKKRNHILLSHWDLDHYLHIPDLVRNMSQVCWQTQPTISFKKSILIDRILALQIPYCTDQAFSIKQWLPQSGKTTNDRSLVQYANNFLLPGDSPKKAEVQWATEFSEIRSTRVLILGHHGSRTSTSSALLAALPNLKMAIASARAARYGHPHQEVLNRLAQKKTPVLKTEDWGSIWFL